MEKIKVNRIASFCIMLAIYVAATFLGVFLYTLLKDRLYFLYGIWIASLCSTVLVFLFGLLFKNAAVYIPYCSLMPVATVILIFTSIWPVGAGPILLGLLVIVFSLLEFVKWLFSFQALAEPNKTYEVLREENKVLWPVVNLLGVHLFPTTVLYLCMIPALLYFDNNAPLTVYSAVGVLICLVAIFIKIVCYLQLYQFKKMTGNNDALLRGGVWGLSRHPNYLANIVFWLGVYLYCLTSTPNSYLYFVGPLVNLFMYLLISIPTAEQQYLKTLPNYAAYRAQTGKLLPKIAIKRKPKRQYWR